jgi:hypothetical protein
VVSPEVGPLKLPKPPKSQNLRLFPPNHLRTHGARDAHTSESTTLGEEADYTLTVVWIGPKGWLYELERKDGARLEPDPYKLKDIEDPNAARVVRKVCRDIERDFPLWLNTQRVRASISKSAQTGVATSVDDDPPRRYEMIGYRNGTIVGIALLDTKLGRAWLLTNITDSGGKTVRTEFNEVSVDGLWKSADELYGDKKFSSSKSVRDEADKFFELKKLTRPIAIQRAEDQADKAR